MLTWEQKLAALQALTDTCLRMRKPGDWYVSALYREIHVEGGLLLSDYGNGKTPQEAVEDDWRRVAENLPRDQYIVLDAYGERRKQVRWDGFMWKEVTD